MMIYSYPTDADEIRIMLAQVQQRLHDYSPRIINAPLPKAAVLIPVTNHSQPEIILTRRASHMSTHSGEVAFPGGKQDDTDNSLIDTALRESQEEIGLMPEDVQVIGQVETVISRFGIEVTPIVGVVEASTELTANAAELDRIFRVPLQFFLDKQNLKYDSLKDQGLAYQMPSFQYQEYRIWGLTAMMLVDFLNVTLDADIAMDAPDISTLFMKHIKAT